MQGHITAQSDLAEMYRLGKGGKKDLAQAAKWYIKAAEQGDAYAQYWAALSYYYEWGVKQNYKKAFQFMKKSAIQEDADAQSMLGDFYRDGIGCKENKKQAIVWWEKAAKQGETEALTSLGKAYWQEGYSFKTWFGIVKRDLYKARSYFEQADANGFPHLKKVLQEIDEEIKEYEELEKVKQKLQNKK